MSSSLEPATLPPPRERNALWLTLQFLVNQFFCIWLGFRARGLERLADVDGGLVVSNHQSFIDPCLIGLQLRRPVSFVARDSLFRVPIIGWILSNTYVMSINRDAASSAVMRETIRRMQHGFLVGLFPEGTRTETGEVGEFKPGFVALVRRAKLPVYPVGIAGGFQALGRGRWFLRPTRVRVVYGRPITIEELAEFDGRDKDRELIEFVRSRVIECHREAEQWRTGHHSGESVRLNRS